MNFTYHFLIYIDIHTIKYTYVLLRSIRCEGYIGYTYTVETVYLWLVLNKNKCYMNSNEVYSRHEPQAGFTNQQIFLLNTIHQ